MCVTPFQILLLWLNFDFLERPDRNIKEILILFFEEEKNEKNQSEEDEGGSFSKTVLTSNMFV